MQQQLTAGAFPLHGTIRGPGATPESSTALFSTQLYGATIAELLRDFLPLQGVFPLLLSYSPTYNKYSFSVFTAKLHLTEKRSVLTLYFFILSSSGQRGQVFSSTISIDKTDISHYYPPVSLILSSWILIIP